MVDWKLALVTAAQDAESGRFHGLEGFVAVGAPQPVLAVAQKREVPAFHPREERLGLAHVPRVEPRTQGVQIVGAAPRGAAHLRPIRAGDAHVAHAALDLCLQGAQDGGIDDAVHFDVLERLEPLLAAVGSLAALLQ